MTEPTDAEIFDVADDFRSQYKHGGTAFDEFDVLGFARAVLERWGTPAPVGVEPVARLEIGKTKGGVSLTHIAEPAAFQLPEGMYALYTTPQPTQAQAGAAPLTPKQMDSGREAIFSTGNPYCPCDSKTFRKVAEWVERHHGITHKEGGQHAE